MWQKFSGAHGSLIVGGISRVDNPLDFPDEEESVIRDLCVRGRIKSSYLVLLIPICRICPYLPYLARGMVFLSLCR